MKTFNIGDHVQVRASGRLILNGYISKILLNDYYEIENKAGTRQFVYFADDIIFMNHTQKGFKGVN